MFKRPIKFLIGASIGTAFAFDVNRRHRKLFSSDYAYEKPSISTRLVLMYGSDHHLQKLIQFYYDTTGSGYSKNADSYSTEVARIICYRPEIARTIISLFKIAVPNPIVIEVVPIDLLNMDMLEHIINKHNIDDFSPIAIMKMCTVAKYTIIPKDRKSYSMTVSVIRTLAKLDPEVLINASNSMARDLVENSIENVKYVSISVIDNFIAGSVHNFYKTNNPDLTSTECQKKMLLEMPNLADQFSINDFIDTKVITTSELENILKTHNVQSGVLNLMIHLKPEYITDLMCEVFIDAIEKNVISPSTIDSLESNRISCLAEYVANHDRTQFFDLFSKINKEIVYEASTFNKIFANKEFFKWVKFCDPHYNFTFTGPGIYDEISKFKSKTCCGGGYHFAPEESISRWKNEICSGKDCAKYQILIPELLGNQVVCDGKMDKCKAGAVELKLPQDKE